MSIEEKKAKPKARRFNTRIVGPILFFLGVLIQQNWDRIESIDFDFGIRIEMQSEEQKNK